MKTVKFFCFDIPVMGEGETVYLPDGDYKFWFLTCEHNGEERGTIFRTKIKEDGSYSIQERIDHYLRHDAGQIPGMGLVGLKAILPANQEAIESWMRSHKWVYRKAA